MTLPDVNVLVCALRRNVPEHSICRRWLDSVILGNQRFGMSSLALAAVVRITTNPRIQRNPVPRDEALGFCDDILSQAHCQIVEPGPLHWDIFKRLCIEADIRGPMATDAWYAALAIEWGCEWVTLDRDFARFPGLKWSLPGA